MAEFIFITIFAVGCTLIVVLWLRSQRRELDEEKMKGRLYKKAIMAYQADLETLKSSPNNPEARQAALQSGRELAEFTRNLAGFGGVTIFDEVALMNDINAASAGSSMPVHVGEKSSTIEERLSKLSGLKDRNLIDEDEYQNQRKKILGEL